METFKDPLLDVMEELSKNIQLKDEDYDKFCADIREYAEWQIQAEGPIIPAVFALSGRDGESEIIGSRAQFPAFPPTRETKRALLAEIGLEVAKTSRSKPLAICLIMDTWRYIPPEGLETKEEVSEWRADLPDDPADWEPHQRHECVLISVVAKGGRRFSTMMEYVTNDDDTRTMGATVKTDEYNDYNISAVIFGWLKGYVVGKLDK